MGQEQLVVLSCVLEENGEHFVIKDGMISQLIEFVTSWDTRKEVSERERENK